MFLLRRSSAQETQIVFDEKQSQKQRQGEKLLNIRKCCNHTAAEDVLWFLTFLLYLSKLSASREWNQSKRKKKGGRCCPFRTSHSAMFESRGQLGFRKTEADLKFPENTELNKSKIRHAFHQGFALGRMGSEEWVHQLLDQTCVVITGRHAYGSP